MELHGTDSNEKQQHNFKSNENFEMFSAEKKNLFITKQFIIDIWSRQIDPENYVKAVGMALYSNKSGEEMSVFKMVLLVVWRMQNIII